MLSSTRHVCVWFVHMHGCTIDCTNEDWWIHPVVREVGGHAPSQQPSPTVSHNGCVGCLFKQIRSLPPITSQLPSISIKLSSAPTPLCSLAVAISSLFLRSSSSDSEICSFLGLRLLHQHPPHPPAPCPHLFLCPLSLDLCLSLLCALPISLFHLRAGADFV